MKDATRKIVVAAEEVDDSPSPALVTSKISLRRDIQKPKWLTDGDMLTNYGIPRGTNKMRKGNGNFPSTSTNPTISGGQAKDQTTSVFKEDAGKNQKSDKGKVSPPSPSMEIEVEEDVTVPVAKVSLLLFYFVALLVMCYIK